MTFKSWLATSSVRFYPNSPVETRKRLRLDAALNERVSFQVLLRHDGLAPRQFTVTATGPDGWDIRVRRVGYIPVRHLNTHPAPIPPEDIEGADQIPGYVPDPLFEEQTILLPGSETHAFWISVRPGPNAKPGPGNITIQATPDSGRSHKLQAEVTLHPITLQPRRDFRITHWFYADSISDWYKVAPFSEEFWPLCEKFIHNYADHGLDTIYVPVFTPSLDGVKRPTQLLKVTKAGKDRYSFDWSDVKRWIDMCRKHNITHFEWAHPFTQWGVKFAIRIYEQQGADEVLLWPPETPATSDTYRNFLQQYLPELRQFLQQEGILERSFFHVSDEPHNEDDKKNYKAARAMLKELAPWMKTMDALTDIEYGRERLTDMPVPSIRTALQFVNENIPCWCYYCCGPRGRYLNRLLDTPLAKIYMHGFLFYRWPFQGFLHWGFNYWYRSQTRALIDVFHIQDGEKWPGWAYGDTTQVYPGPDGPLDSIRWEVFSESLQDYQLLQTLNVPRDSDLLKKLHSFEDFPKTSRWRNQTRKQLFALAATQPKKKK